MPLSSDVLDVDIAGPSTRKTSQPGSHEHQESLPQLAVASLVSGKVVLIDYSKLASSHAEGSPHVVDDSDDEGPSQEPQRQRKLYTKPWNIKPGSKSCRASRFTDGELALSSHTARELLKNDLLLSVLSATDAF